MKLKRIDAILVTVLLVTIISTFAHTWQQTTTLAGYGGGIAMSADGRIICAIASATRGYPVMSTNSGDTWFFATNKLGIIALQPDNVAMSADGSKIFAYLGTNISSLTTLSDIFVSNDRGASWEPTGFPGITVFRYYRVACSADGMKVIVAVENGPIYYSTNGGMNCYTSSVPDAAWQSVDCSADGSQMVAVNFSGVYFSKDFGASWTLANLHSASWSSVCISSDAQWAGALNNSNSFISCDGGATWRTNAILGRTISCSANGTNWLIVGSQLYTSTNSGIDWTTNLAPAQWYAGAVSADGCEMIALGSSLGTCMGRLTPSPQLNIQSQASSANISWLTPSTNFVLQQNTDLSTSNWITISNTPALNFTNLNQEVGVPVTTTNTFFRLMAQ